MRWESADQFLDALGQMRSADASMTFERYFSDKLEIRGRAAQLQLLSDLIVGLDDLAGAARFSPDLIRVAAQRAIHFALPMKLVALHSALDEQTWRLLEANVVRLREITLGEDPPSEQVFLDELRARLQSILADLEADESLDEDLRNALTKTLLEVLRSLDLARFGGRERIAEAAQVALGRLAVSGHVTPEAARAPLFSRVVNILGLAATLAAPVSIPADAVTVHDLLSGGEPPVQIIVVPRRDPVLGELGPGSAGELPPPSESDVVDEEPGS